MGQQKVRRHFGRLIRQLGRLPLSAGARRELLKSRHVYDLDRQVAMPPYAADKVKVVREGTLPRDITKTTLVLGRVFEYRLAPAPGPAPHLSS